MELNPAFKSCSTHTTLWKCKLILIFSILASLHWIKGHNYGHFICYKWLYRKYILLDPSNQALKNYTVRNNNSNVSMHLYTGCTRRNLPYFGRMFLRLNFIDTTNLMYIPKV